MTINAPADTTPTAQVDTILRVDGADESYLLAEEIFGMSAPIQYAWIFDKDPGFGVIADLHRQLEQGHLSRSVVRSRVPLARHRWVRSPKVSALELDSTTIADDQVGQWVDAILRGANLRPADGVGWQLDTICTADGKRIVSLLVSHMVADGQAVYRALAAAADGRVAQLPPAHSAAGFAGLRDDITDAVRQLGAASTSLRILVTEALRGLSTRGDAAVSNTGARPRGAGDAPAARSTRGPAATEAAASLRTGIRPDVAGGPETTLAIVDIDRASWHACASKHGGTSGSLFTAFMAGVLQRSGYPVGDETKVCIAVSNRDADLDAIDDRANASGGVWIRLPDAVQPGMDLSDIRARSKRAFIEYSSSGADKVADNLAPVVRLLPRSLIGRLMRSIAGPDTTVSSLGVAPASAVTFGGVTASSFAIRAIMQGTPAEQRRKQGPAVAAWAVEYAEHLTLTSFGIHPDYFGDEEMLRNLIGSELSSWGIGHTFW